MLNFQEQAALPLLLLALLLFICYLAYRRTNPRLAKLSKAGLIILRTLSLVILALVLLRPLVGWNYVSRLPPEVAVLLDNSSSMHMEDGSGSRAKSLQNIVASEMWKKLEKNSQVKYFGFSDSLHGPEVNPNQLDFTGKATSLSQALLDLQKKSPDLSAVILISDGGHNRGADPGWAAGQLNFPVYAIGVGSEIPPLDLALSDLDYPKEVYLGSPALIKLSVAGTGVKPEKLKVTLKEGERILEEKEVTVSGEGRKQEVEMRISPDKEGVHNYQFSLPQLSGEKNLKNNRRQFSLKVLKSKIKTLGLAGNLTWEYHFLKEFTESQENLEASWAVFDRSRILEGKLPQSAAEWGGFELVILVNPSADFLAGREKVLQEYVENQGHSLLILLDDNFTGPGFSARQYKLLPFDMAGGLSTSHSQFNFTFNDPPETNPLLKLSEDREENRRLWQDLPPFLGCVAVRKTVPQAKILAVFQTDSESPAYPVLLAQEFGKGKVLTALAFPFWRWDFVLTGLGHDNTAYAKFFSNAILWLTAQKTEKGLELETDKIVYQAGESVKFKAGYRDELGGKASGGEMKVTVKNLSSGSKLELELSPDRENDFSASLTYLEPGNYSAEAVYTVEGNNLARARKDFQVEEYSLEDQTLTMNRQLLSQIAELSGGKFYTAADYPKLPEDLVLQERIVEKEKRWEIWNQPGILIIALLFLSLEWFLRRRHQLP